VLTLTVGVTESFDSSKGEFGEFVEVGGFELQLEHSLAVLSKWEEIHEKPFLGLKEPTTEETLDYVRCMIVSPNPPDDVLELLTQEHYTAINDYMNRKMTATWFREMPGGRKTGEVITADLIYYWMTAFGMPPEWQHIHLNQLFTRIKVADAKQQKPKKMAREDAAAQQRALNRQRRADLGSTG